MVHRKMKALHHHQNKGGSVTESDNPPDMDPIIRVTALCILQTGLERAKEGEGEMGKRDEIYGS